jgi:predicted glycogen debranching enzyme
MLLCERSHGLVPNRFSDRNSRPEYNTADATLWLFIAARDYIERTKDWEFLRDVFYPAALDILAWHQRGTGYDIHVDSTDHLLSCGTPHTQLTWMDAQIGDLPVTPRAGKPVEINALWYNALRITAHWAQALGAARDGERYNNEARLVLVGFQTSFWNPQRGCLYDVIGPSSRDPRVRPNQLFALSLAYAMLDRERARGGRYRTAKNYSHPWAFERSNRKTCLPITLRRRGSATRWSVPSRHCMAIVDWPVRRGASLRLWRIGSSRQLFAAKS